MKHVWKIVLLMCVVLLTMNGLVQAQEASKTFCGNLSKADCNLMTESETVMKGLDSRSFKLDMTMGMSGIPKYAHR